MVLPPLFGLLPRRLSGFLSDPLKPRFVKGLGLMLLPLLCLGSGSLLALHGMEQSLKALSNEIRYEMAQIDRVELLAVRCTASAGRYLLFGAAADRQLLAGHLAALDDAFAAIDPNAFADEQERALIAEARQLWHDNRGLGQALVETTAAAAESVTLRLFADRMETMLGLLDHAHRLGDREISEEVAEFEESRRLILGLISGLFVLGLVLAVGAGLVLARSILQPVAELKGAAAAWRNGALETRLVPRGRDELAGLMESFNAMAAELQESQRQLAALALTDPLTGLFNRREFMHRMTTELERATRYGHPMVLLLLDLDHFKRVNDNFGHPAGDLLLQNLAQVLRQQLRQGDLVARYGGEEFVALLPETTREAALATAERIRQAVAELVLPVAEAALRVTVSIGCAELAATTTQGEALFAAADRALYRAKAEGRNRVCLAAD